MDPTTTPRWLGWLWLVGGCVTATAALVGALVGWLAVGSATRLVEDSIHLSRDALISVADGAEAADDVFDDVAGSLRDVQGTLAEGSLTLTRAAAVTSGLGGVVTEQVPDSIDAVRDAMPGLIDTAGVVDGAMRGLAFFGVDYAPDVPLGEALAEIDSRLAEIPTLLRRQQDALAGIAGDLGAFGSATLAVSDDLGRIRSRLGDIDVVLAGYGRLVSESDTVLARLEDQLLARGRILRILTVVVGLGVAATQTAPIALGRAVLGAGPGRTAPGG